MNEIDLKFRPVYKTSTEKSIRSEFKRLEGKCYLDHAGATLYSEKQIANVFKDLEENLYANPHARSTPSKASEDAIDQIRYRVLQHFNTDSNEYTVVFTSGATHSLQTVAESFDYNGGELVYLENNHTSVLGMREYSQKSRSLSHADAYKCFDRDGLREIGAAEKNSLFVYPAQCNFSGFKYPLSWIDGLGNLGGGSNWFCMLDAASYVCTNSLDLSENKPDFVGVSFYKMFGYPTGLGALLVKNGSGGVLNKRYFGGGTVFMALSSENVVVRRENLHERFEDGTLPFLSIISLRHGFETLKRLHLTMEYIGRHTFALAKYVYNNLATLNHGNGRPACILYSDTTFDDPQRQSGIVNFNLLRADGSHVGYSEVMHICNLYGISLRTGCFCNPGACRRHLKMTTEDVKHHFEKGHVCGDQNDLIDDKPTGSVRISFGYMSTKKDADDFLEMIVACFVGGPVVRKLPVEISIGKITKPVQTKPNKSNRTIEGKLNRIFLYPVKSCGAFSVKGSWKLVETGLQYDRDWMIVNSAGVCMTQKQDARMCLIKPVVDLQREMLILTCENHENVSVPLEISSKDQNAAFSCPSKVCGDEIRGYDCGDEASRWLENVLNVDGLRLLRQCGTTNRTNNAHKSKLSLVNKAQFLLINQASVEWLADCVPKNDPNESIDALIDRFRPNLVVDFKTAFLENDVAEFVIARTTFTYEAMCTRCQMICIDQSTGEKSVEPLRTLSKEFNGKISFGIYLRHSMDDSGCDNVINVNSVVYGL